MIWKIKVWLLRLGEYFTRLPFRLFQFFQWLLWLDHPQGRHQVARWSVGLFLKAIDLTPVPWIIEIFLDLAKWNTRGLNANQKGVIAAFFRGAINPEFIGLDSKSWFARKGRASAFVTLHTINFYGTLPDSVLIHEAVHIWQYRHHGSLYITEALYAQHGGGGYDYGGIPALNR
ncbi:MAG TPA: hypothetical protein VJ508_18850, partial [Saprospiraceae bacterium]|nr:hypothetical protein [Saprospiraceae bacterium]